jgi:hypothetical protein
MIQQPVQRRRGTINVARSSLAIEILLNIYAVVVVVIIARFVLLAASVVPALPLSSRVYGASDPFVRLFGRLPGADFMLIGKVTLPDVTVVAMLLLVPLAALARSRRRG